MQVTEQSLRERYQEMDSEELVRHVCDGTLTEVAQRLAVAELDARGLTSEQRAELEHDAKVNVAGPTADWLASPWSRLVSQVIDALIAFVLLIVPSLVAGVNDVTLTIGFTGLVGYLLLADALPRGQSLGKRVMGTAVIDRRTQRPCGIGQSALRNSLGVFGFIDWLFIFGRMRQRLGDQAANTLVVNLATHQDPATGH